MSGLEFCERPFAHFETERAIAEENLARNFLGSKQALGQGASGRIYWLPGMGNPAAGLTKGRRDMAPLSRLLESGKFSPGPLRPL